MWLKFFFCWIVLKNIPKVLRLLVAILIRVPTNSVNCFFSCEELSNIHCLFLSHWKSYRDTTKRGKLTSVRFKLTARKSEKPYQPKDLWNVSVSICTSVCLFICQFVFSSPVQLLISLSMFCPSVCVVLYPCNSESTETFLFRSLRTLVFSHYRSIIKNSLHSLCMQGLSTTLGKINATFCCSEKPDTYKKAIKT